jgi:leucyl-tRNA synthetase
VTTYNFAEIEKKWQEIWAKRQLFTVKNRDERPKYYCLVMFPYPSGKLHMGHVRNYVLGDVFARFYRMKGRQVLNPIGWDAFGLPAENAAIKNKVDPEKWTRANIRQMSGQLKALGISYDWPREIATCDPGYYKWNQWFFIKMWERGLAYRKKARVNWCPSCKTVLANEQVNQGRCWRCDSVIEDRELEQWFLRITAYADELLTGQELIRDGWPEEVLAMQKNWIGKSLGAEVDFEIQSEDKRFSTKIRIFTTRPDTLFGATFMVVAPEHDLLNAVRGVAMNGRDIEKYVLASGMKSNIERAGEKEKTGLKLEGLHAVNPVTGIRIPVFVADYVLMGYGTGAIMAVPAHDQRDWEFANKYNVPVIEVIHSAGAKVDTRAYEGDGVMVNSGPFNGTSSKEGAAKVTEWLEEKGLGTKAVNFRLKDWLVSRQRYWGTPIPMLYCDACGIVPVPDNELPVVLPRNVEFTGLGQSPLAVSAEFVDAACPKCGGKARRETDTMDTFVDSSWYFARYCDPKNDTQPFDPGVANAWLPVDQYIGGIEHACMHLIYARFWFKVMRDLGLVNSNEPFTRLLTQGMVTLGGSAMSKSKGNIVTQDEIVSKFGADTARLFIMFAAPPEKQLEWSSDGVEGSWRFINRVCRLYERIHEREAGVVAAPEREAAALRRVIHQTINKVSNDIEKEQQLNTAISAVMELVNTTYQYAHLGDLVSKEAVETAVLLLAPFTPHICEELWEKSGHNVSVVDAPWPQADPNCMVEETVEIPVQVNGKMRGLVRVPANVTEAELRRVIESDTKICVHLENRKLVKFIYVPGKIANVVVA